MHDIGGLEYCHGRTLRIMVWFNFSMRKLFAIPEQKIVTF